MYVEHKVRKRYRQHRTEWKSCQRCPLSKTRSRVCTGRGRLPCDCLFIGEAPGQVEDACGEPFLGSAGRLLDRWIAEIDVKFTWAITNMLGCLPLDTETIKIRRPTGAELALCLPRLNEFIRLASPTVLVLLGKVAGRNFRFPDGFEESRSAEDVYCPTLDLVHPAHTLRVGGFGSWESREQIEKLNEFLKEQLHEKK